MSEEKVLGGLEVETELQYGKEHLFLLYTAQRIIFTHLGKVGANRMAFSRLLGGLADGIGRSSANRNELNRIVALPPDEILKLHKDNFAVAYDRWVSLSMEHESYGKVLMTLVTSDMKIPMIAALPAAVDAGSGLRDALKEKFESRL